VEWSWGTQLIQNSTVSACRTCLESLSRVKHSGGLDLLTSGVNFWFHLNSGYPHPLGSYQLTQDPLQRSPERYLVGSCTTGAIKKRTQHNGRFQLSLPVGSAEIEPSPSTFQRCWSRRWVGRWIVDLDSGCPVLHFLLGFLLRRRGVSTALRLSARVLEDLAPWPANDSSADLALRVLAKIESELVLKLGMMEKKLSST
jgi:hypothetical protein